MGQLLNDLIGSTGPSQTTTVQYMPEQVKDIQNRMGEYGYYAPGMRDAFNAGRDVYNQSLPGVNRSLQNLGNIGNQVGQTTGETGESALRTGISGLQSLFNPQYESNQINAALMPAQAQYMQNLAGQQAQYGGSGQLGSARDKLASQQLAGMNAMNQAQIAAQVGQNIANQRAQVGTNLAQLGQAGLNQSLGAYGQGANASMMPLQYAQQYQKGQYSLPSWLTTPSFPGQQGSTQNNGIGLGGLLGTGLGWLLG